MDRFNSAVSTLLLNHAWTPWGAADVVATRTIPIPTQLPGGLERLEKAKWVAAQAGVSGEIENIWEDGDRLAVPVMRPGVRITDIKVDFQAAPATVEQNQTNGWGVIRWLHHFTGVRMDRSQMQRWRWAWGFLGAGVLVSGLFLFGLGWIT